MKNLFLGVTIFLALAPRAVAAEGKQWVVLIAVKDHEEKKHNLRFTVADADLLARTLQERAGIPKEQFLEMSDRSAEHLRPRLANLRKQIPEFLARIGPNDRLILFYSGHGFITGGKSYLIPSDCKSTDIPNTALEIREVREALAKCKASVKFLILDSCHSGGADRSLDSNEVVAEALARDFEPRKLTGCVILASSTAEEKSWEWPARGQGVFTYWLCRALEGGADKDGDGELTFEEVYDYTHERVRQTAQQLVGYNQTPVRLVGGDVRGTPNLLKLLPEKPESLCRRLAEHLDLEIRRQKLKRVGVLEFIVPLGKVEGLARANLPKFCAERVQAALAKLNESSYQVVDESAMQVAARGVRVEEVGKPDTMSELQRKANGMDGVITGSLRRDGSNLLVQCELFATSTGRRLARPSGVVAVSEELLADNGASFDNRQRPQGSPVAPPVVRHVEVQAVEPHPLMNQNFPFRIEVWTIQTKPGETITPSTPRRKKEFVNLSGGNLAEKLGLTRNDLLIGANKDEIIELRIRNDSGNRVAMVLLVDGLNTLGGGRERVGDAWPWVLEPKKDYVIEGWYTPKGPNAQPGRLSDYVMNRFLFRDAAPVSGRQEFAQSLGLITAAFYEERGRSVQLDKLRVDEQRELRNVDFKVGRLAGAIHLRYADERDLRRILEGG